MRTKRLRIDDSDSTGTYYHLYNRAVGGRSDRPFGDDEKEKLVALILQLGAIYTLEILGFVVMSNHWHIVVYAPHGKPDRAESLRRWQLMYPKLQPPANEEDWHVWESRIRNISEYAKDFQQKFTCWYNRHRPGLTETRRGTIWEDRFSSVILQGDNGNSAVWSCLKYIELNPVRAKMVAEPADYRWSSWGRYCGSGKHPFAAAFEKHLRSLRGQEADNWTAADTYAAMRSELVRMIAAESGATSGEIFAIAEEAKAKPDVWVRIDRRVRYWTDGAVIGSREFVRSVYASIFGEDKARRRRFGRGEDAPGGAALYSMRRPQEE